MSNEDESQTPVKQIMLETIFMMEPEKHQDELEQWGMIERTPKSKKFKKLTPKGIKKALNMSLALAEEGGT